MINALVWGAYLLSLQLSLITRSGIWDAMEYRKSKSRIRKERKKMTVWQKIFCILPKDIETFAPRHLQLFHRIRTANFFSMLFLAICFLCFTRYDTIKRYLYWTLALKFMLIDVPFAIYALVSQLGSKNKRWDFDYFKKP